MGKFTSFKELEDEYAVPDSNLLKDYHSVDNSAVDVAASGATWGLYPRMRAALETGTLGWETLGASPEQSEAYTRRKRELEARIARHRQYRPWESFGLDVGGSMLNPLNYVGPLGGSRVAQAGRAGHVVTPGSQLTNTQRAARLIGVGEEIGGVGTESIKLGAKQGAAFGAGASPEEGLGRIRDTVTGAVTGGVIGGAAGKAVQGLQTLARGPVNLVNEVARTAGDATESRVGETAARLRMNKELAGAGVSAREIAENIIPDTVLKNTAEMRARGKLLRQALMEGGDDPVQTYIRLTREAGSQLPKRTDATLAGHMKTVQSRIRNDMPLTLDEVATSQRMPKNEKGEIRHAKGLIDTRRAIQMTPGEHQDKMQDFVINRQRGVLEHTRNKIDNMTATPEEFEALQGETQKLASDLYDYADQVEEPFDIRDILEEYWNVEAWRSGAAEDAISDVLRVFGVNPDTGLAPPTTLQKFRDARQVLNESIQDAMRVTPQGKENTTASRLLNELKEKLDERVAANNPAWKEANDLAANGFAMKDAYNEGRRISVSGGGRTSVIMKNVKQLRTSMDSHAAKIKKLRKKQNTGAGLDDKETSMLKSLEKQLTFMENKLAAYKQGFGETLRDMIGKTGDLHDPAKYFKKGIGTDRGPRQIISEVFGPKVAKKFMDQMDDVGRVGQTTRQYGGSQTAEILLKNKELTMDDAINAAADAATLNPGGLVKQAARKWAEVYGGNRNRHLGDMFTTTTHDLPAFMKTLGDLDRFKSQTTGQGVGVPGWLQDRYFEAPGRIGVGMGRSEIEEQNRWDRLYRDRDDEEWWW